MWSSKIEWGKLYGFLSPSKKVLHLAWKDAQVVLFMTTVHTGLKTVVRPRRRPATTASGAAQTRKIFSDEAVKKLPIPKFIDMYNHQMNGIDIADQLRMSYTSQRRSYHTWRPLWHFLLDQTVVNSYKLSSQSNPGHIKSRAHFEFTEQLAFQLCERSIAQSERKSTVEPPSVPARLSLAAVVAHVDRNEHGTGAVRMPCIRAKYCVACEAAGRTRSAARGRARRVPFTELNPNSLRMVPDGRGGKTKCRRIRASRSVYGCIVCNVHLCKNTRCWVEHLNSLNTTRSI